MFNKRIKIPTLPIVIFTLTLYLFTACDSTETNDGTVSFSFYSEPSTEKIAADSITIDSAKFILYNINIKGQSDTDTKGVKVGPFLVYINVTGMTTDFAVGNIPPGFYDQIKFEVHQLKDVEVPPDPEFVEGSLRFSAIIKGTYNSDPFVFKYQKSAHQDLKLITPIEVTENSIANLTIIVDPNSWFRENGNILNPADPGNESLIDDNIKQSFKKIVLDNNHDGIAD
jgi:hypothetical protein